MFFLPPLEGPIGSSPPERVQFRSAVFSAWGGKDNLLNSRPWPGDDPLNSSVKYFLFMVIILSRSQISVLDRYLTP